MATFDTSDVAAKVNPGQQINPLKTVEGLANLQNSLNQNRFFQARTLAGRYLEQSTGPDGQPDLKQFSASLQSDPRTASFAPEILQDVATLRGTGIANVQAGTNLAQSQFLNLQRDISTFGNSSKANDPNQRAIENQRAVTSALAAGVAAGRYPSQMATDALGDGSHFQDVVRASTISGAGGQGPQDVMAPQPTTVQTGGGTQFVAPNRYLGESQPMTGESAFIPNVLGAKDLATPVSVINPEDLSKSMHTLGDYIDPKTGMFKPGIKPPLIDAGPLATTTSAALGQAYGPEIKNYETEIAAAPVTKQLIGSMRRDLTQFGTGPHSQFWTEVGELAHEYDPSIDTSKISSSEEFTKIVPTLLRHQAALLGMNETDTGRQISAAAIPSKNLTPEGIHKILGYIEGNVDALNAAGKLWEQQKTKYGPQTYGNFRINFSKNLPPDLFRIQYMTPAEISELQKGWSKEKLTDFNNKLSWAKAQGLIGQ